MRNAALAIMIGLGVASTAFAADEPRSPYAAVLGTFVEPGGVRDADYGLGGIAIYGLPIGNTFNFELSAFGNHFKRESGSSATDAQYGLGLDVMLPLLNGPIKPFLLAGAGALREELGTSADRTKLSPYLDAGAGVLFGLTKNLSARAEARYIRSANGSSYPTRSSVGDGRFSVGLQYAFLTPPPPPPPVAVVAPPPPPPPPPPADSDGDGVIDPLDKCPNTPAGVKVDVDGCPLDSDGDGVPDYLDQCPGTPKGYKVDDVGCIIEQTVILRDVNFEFNKAVLTSTATASLDQLAGAMTAQPKLTVEIGGHTDSKGSDVYNLVLSKKRAEAVAVYLRAKGIDGGRMAAVGYGETKPIASNDTDEGRAENRRVEFRLLNKPLDVKVIKKRK